LGHGAGTLRSSTNTRDLLWFSPNTCKSAMGVKQCNELTRSNSSFSAHFWYNNFRCRDFSYVIDNTSVPSASWFVLELAFLDHYAAICSWFAFGLLTVKLVKSGHIVAIYSEDEFSINYVSTFRWRSFYCEVTCRIFTFLMHVHSKLPVVIRSQPFVFDNFFLLFDLEGYSRANLWIDCLSVFELRDQLLDQPTDWMPVCVTDCFVSQPLAAHLILLRETQSAWDLILTFYAIKSHILTKNYNSHRFVDIVTITDAGRIVCWVPSLSSGL